MAGELSKKIGELGEKLAREFINNIGWNIVAENIDITCEKNDQHARKKAHGLDFLVAYDCPLTPQIRRNILISMKNSSKEETSGQSTTVKQDIQDLNYAIQCFKRSHYQQEVNQDTSLQCIEYSGVLIKINKDKDTSESFLRNLREKERVNAPEEDVVYFIENKRFDLVDLTLKHIRATRPKEHTFYSYPITNQTYAAEVANIDGSLIPIQHLSASPLTFKHVRDSTKEFIVYSPSNFSKETLERLVGLSYGCSKGWASKVTVVFPELTETDKLISEGALRSIKSNLFAESITVESLDLRSRFSNES